MSETNIISQAERLWLQLVNARAQAEAEQNISRRLRIERLSDRAFFRLLRRMNRARRYPCHIGRMSGASWAELERR